jgi:hypothetical protein
MLAFDPHCIPTEISRPGATITPKPGVASYRYCPISSEHTGLTSPMTYVARNGKKYVIIVSSGMNAFVLE